MLLLGLLPPPKVFNHLAAFLAQGLQLHIGRAEAPPTMAFVWDSCPTWEKRDEWAGPPFCSVLLGIAMRRSPFPWSVFERGFLGRLAAATALFDGGSSGLGAESTCNSNQAHVFAPESDAEYDWVDMNVPVPHSRLEEAGAVNHRCMGPNGIATLLVGSHVYVASG